MRIQAEVSLYPLRTPTMMEPIEAFCEVLAQSGLEVETGSMSTHVVGESERVFAALGRAFERVGEKGQVVLIAKVANCCPRA